MKIRIDNIECRPIKGKENAFEIMKWHKNDLYNKQNEFLEKGYELKDDIYKKDNFGYSESCFINPESGYVIAILDINLKEPDITLRSVGDRLLRLKKKEKKAFWKVYEVANDLILKEIENETEKDR